MPAAYAAPTLSRYHSQNVALFFTIALLLLLFQVILHLESTLSKSEFQSVLLESGAADQYVSYLRQSSKPLEAEDITALIG